MCGVSYPDRRRGRAETKTSEWCLCLEAVIFRPMKLGGTAAVFGVLSGLLLSAGSRAVIADTAGNPYQAITERNIFGLKPPTPPVSPEDNNRVPASKIKLTGITTILGRKQALLLVTVPPRPPQPAREDSYILTEGQRDGEIEVLNIDETAGSVKVKNHGVVQTLDFVNDGNKLPAASSLPQPGAPPGMAPGARPPAMPQAALGPGMRQIPPRPLRAAPSPGIGQQTASSAGASAAYGGAPNAGFMGGTTATAPQQQQITPEEQTLMFEAQRAELLDKGNSEVANLIPPTELTPQVMQPQMPQ
jgi:hypothetical protein